MIRRQSAVALLFLLTLLAAAASADDTPARPVKEPALRDELLRRAAEDQEVRKAAMELFGPQSGDAGDEIDPAEFDWDAFAKEQGMDPATAAEVKSQFQKANLRKVGKKLLPTIAKGFRVDLANTARMKEIIEKHGWPGKTLVGPAAAHSAWLMVQHADHDRPFQKKCLALLQKAVKEGEAEGQQLAYLTDRVLVAENKKQLYGTQLSETNGALVPQPIEDEANVDQRRKEVGLEPLADYVKTASQFYKVPTSSSK